MPTPQLDRFLETCIKRDAEWVALKSGQVARIQLKDEQREFAIPAVDQYEIETFAAYLLEIGNQPAGHGNQVRFRITYGGQWAFEVVVVGEGVVEEVWLLRDCQAEGEEEHPL